MCISRSRSEPLFRSGPSTEAVAALHAAARVLESPSETASQSRLKDDQAPVRRLQASVRLSEATSVVIGLKTQRLERITKGSDAVCSQQMMRYLFRHLQQSSCFLFARLLHHLGKDAAWILKQRVRFVIRVNFSCVQNLEAEPIVLRVTATFYVVRVYDARFSPESCRCR